MMCAFGVHGPGCPSSFNAALPGFDDPDGLLEAELNTSERKGTQVSSARCGRKQEVSLPDSRPS